MQAVAWASDYVDYHCEICLYTLLSDLSCILAPPACTNPYTVSIAVPIMSLIIPRTRPIGVRRDPVLAKVRLPPRLTTASSARHVVPALALPCHRSILQSVPTLPLTMLPNCKPSSPPSGTATYSLGAFRLDSTKRPRVEQAKPTRQADSRFSSIEAAAQRVYDFARTSAQHISTLCGLDEDYCLRLIFQRGAVLLPTLEQETLSSCQFSRCESLPRL